MLRLLHRSCRTQAVLLFWRQQAQEGKRRATPHRTPSPPPATHLLELGTGNCTSRSAATTTLHTLSIWHTRRTWQPCLPPPGSALPPRACGLLPPGAPSAGAAMRLYASHFQSEDAQAGSSREVAMWGDTVRAVWSCLPSPARCAARIRCALCTTGVRRRWPCSSRQGKRHEVAGRHPRRLWDPVTRDMLLQTGLPWRMHVARQPCTGGDW